MGVQIDGPDLGRVTVHGVGIDGLRGAAAPLDCGNAGTAMRLLMGLLAGQRFELASDTLIGRSQSCAIAVPLATVSGAHARIVAIGPRFVLTDLGSTHGTIVNGARCTSVELRAGDEIVLGGQVLRFEQ